MHQLQDFPITRRWPAKHPDRIQLYSFPTPNGVKASIMLEETGLPYEAHLVNVLQGEAGTDAFLSLNPNRKIPAIIDPDGPGGKPIALFESGAILTYLAEKAGVLLPTDPATRYETLQWLFFQSAHISPSFSHFNWFHLFAGRAIEDKRPLDRFREDCIRLLGVLEQRLGSRRWIMGDDYTIADIQLFPWVIYARDDMQAQDVLELNRFPRTLDWASRAAERPASKKGRAVPAIPA